MNRHGITRDKHFIENLKDRHEIHVIQHTQPFQNKLKDFINPKNILNSLKEWTIVKDGIYHHHVRHLYFTRFNSVLRINNKIFKYKIKEIIRDYKIEVMICGPNHYLHGFPPFDLNIPIIFDYLDFLHDFKNPNLQNINILTKYYKNADKILCVSKTLKDTIIHKYKKKAEYLPNGVDLKYFKEYKPPIKEDLHTKLVSLIGLSISESLFYLDIFPKIKEKVQNIKMLLVGGGPRFPAIKNYIYKNKDPADFILTGYVHYKKIRKYFFRTDVGLYPTLKNMYYDSACPLKVFEYSAARKPIVSTNLEELKRLNFPNVFLTKPTAKDYIENIIKALNYDGPFPDLKKFDWKYLSKKLEKIIKNI